MVEALEPSGSPVVGSFRRGEAWAAFLSFLFFLMMCFFWVPASEAKSWERVLESYDPNTEVTLEGEVLAITIPHKGMVALEIARGERGYLVYLCPIWYYWQINLELRAGEKVELKVSKLYTKKGGPIFVARSLTLPSKQRTIHLRDESYRPLWRGQGARGFSP